jgi:hypothetical protein
MSKYKILSFILIIIIISISVYYETNKKKLISNEILIAKTENLLSGCNPFEKTVEKVNKSEEESHMCTEK